MSRESRCEHDIAEQETAVADHLCPLCLEAKVAEKQAWIDLLEGLRKAAIKLWYEEQTRRQAAEAKVEAVREAALAAAKYLEIYGYSTGGKLAANLRAALERTK